MASRFSRITDLLSNGGIRRLSRGAIDFIKYDIWKPIRTKIYGFADRHHLVGPDEIYNSGYYLKRLEDPWRSESNHVGDVILQYFDPESVIDFGCAIGAHLEPLEDADVDVFGVEGNQAAVENAVISSDRIVQADLRDGFSTEVTYDIALSIEVAEHIPERFADVFVDTICNSASIAIITAAPPGQGGTHHVNEQPPEYWIEKFDERGFEFDRDTTDNLRAKFEVEHSTWVTENLLVFRNQ